MNDESFWAVVEQLRGAGGADIETKLSSLSEEDIVEFRTILFSLLHKACSFPLLAANFVIESYVSDDVFRSFRAWLILQGRGRFFQAVGDPDSIAQWLTLEEIDNIADGELLLTETENAYRKMGADVSHPPLADRPLVQEWPANKEEFRDMWPKLVDKFWNQKLIDEMHP